MKTYIPIWQQLPKVIRPEYEGGMTVLELSRKYNVNTSAMRLALIYHNTKIRPPGGPYPGRVYQSSKLTPEQVQAILTIDRNQPEVTHMELGERFGVSRERIRQICFAAGHITRRNKFVSQAMLSQEKSMAKKLARQEVIKNISEAWKRGMSMENMAIVITGTPKKYHYAMMRISQLRQTYGTKLFPYRKKNHWSLRSSEENAKRIQDMAIEWNQNGDINRIQRLFGYCSYSSAYAGLARLRKQWPGLFELKKTIMQRRLKQIIGKQ